MENPRPFISIAPTGLKNRGQRGPEDPRCICTGGQTKVGRQVTELDLWGVGGGGSRTRLPRGAAASSQHRRAPEVASSRAGDPDAGGRCLGSWPSLERARGEQIWARRHLWNDDREAIAMDLVYGTLVRRARSCRATAATETLDSAIARKAR
jgi:hypothetical protein